MNELITALLGGGALAQLLTVILTLRQNKRQMNASALGGEVEALEKTIRVVYDNFERADALHSRERDKLNARIEELEKANEQLRIRIELLTAELEKMRLSMPAAIA